MDMTGIIPKHGPPRRNMTSHQLEFRLSENPWAPTAVIAELNERTGSGLELVALADQVGGTSSAAFVQWPDGQPAALTRTTTPLRVMQQTARVLGHARDLGLPVPRHDLVVELSDGYVAVVQERRPGRAVDRVDAGVVDEFVAMNERFADVLADYRDVARPAAFPELGLKDYGWGDTVGRQGDRGRRLLGRLLEIDGGEPFRMTGDDLVHTDYSLENVLFDEQGHISGVVDWNQGAVRGDRRVALIKRLGADEHPNVLPEAHERIDQVLAGIDPTALKIYQAHWKVLHVHYAISNKLRDDRIEHDLRAAEQFFDEVS
jgi:aminoglycoside phosphotransferase (APT) family kinase protein